MTRALMVLTGGALLTLVVEGLGSGRSIMAAAVGTVFAVGAVVGFGWVGRREPGRRRGWAVAYLAGMLPLGFLMFGVAGGGVGATLLLMVLVSQSVLLLPLEAAAAVVAVVPLVHAGMGMADGLRNGLGTLAAAAFTAVFTELWRREQRAREELAVAHERLRGYAAQAEELATSRERNRLARDIHDGLGHHLTVVQMQVQAARAVLPGDPARAEAVLAGAQRQASEALAEVRRSVAALREPRAATPLDEALTALAQDASAAGVPTEVEFAGTVRTLGPDARETLFRAAQEGLTNVCKHAVAGWARVVLDYRDDGSVRLEIRDDGRGSASLDQGSGRGFGLLGLRERAERLGGRVDVESVPGRGTTVRVAVPG